MMHTQRLTMDEHATLWPTLHRLARHISGPDDITIAKHEALGVVIVEHYGFESELTYRTEQPIPAELIA